MKLNFLNKKILVLIIFTSFAYAQDCDYVYGMYGGSHISYIKETVESSCQSYSSCKIRYNHLLKFVKNCEEWAKFNGHTKRFKEIKKIFEPVLAREVEQAKQVAIKNEEEINQREEIFGLIESNAEANLILDKCYEYHRRFKRLQECVSIQDSIKTLSDIIEIADLLKANKLEESIDKCNEHKLFLKENECLKECKQPVFSIDGGERRLKTNSEKECFEKCGISSNEKITDLCEKQLVAKVKKLPKNKIKTVALTRIYHDCSNDKGDDDDNCKKIMGYVFDNDGKKMLVEDLVWGHVVMVQYAGYIGECRLRETRKIPFAGYGKYLGEKVYTTVMGARKSVPSYQLLWCD